MLNLSDIRDIIFKYFPEGLFIQRERDKNIVYSSATISSKYEKLNFLFVNDLVTDTNKNDTGDLKYFIEGNSIQQTRYKGFKYAQNILEMIQRNDYTDEYYHLKNLLEESIAAQIYLKKKHKEILTKKDSQNTYQEYSGNLLEVISFVREKYGELFDEEKNKVSDSLRKAFEERYDDDDDSVKFEDLKSSGLDTAALIVYILARTASKASFANNAKTDPSIETILESLKSDITNLKKFENFRRTYNKNSIEAILSVLYYRSYGILSNVKDKGNPTKISRNVYGRFENVYHIPEIEHEYDQTWNLSASENRKHVVWAPNGYGKTTFLKSILFSSSTDFINFDSMSETGKKLLNELKKFHGFYESDYLPIYIEAAYYSEIDYKETNQWLYEIVKAQMGFDESQISSEDYLHTIEKYNSNNKLIYLIDGYDELEDQYRPEFHKALNQLFSDKQYGSNALIVVASRPYFEVINFNGYDIWSIKPISFENNKNAIRELIFSYTRGGEYSSPEKVFDILSNNYYLNKMITTPEILIDAISGCMDYIANQESYNSDICDIVESTISDLIQRDADATHSTTVDKYGGIEKIELIYAALAYENIANTRGIEAGNFVNDLRKIIEQICSENRGNGELAYISSLPNADIVRLFFTKMSIFESTREYIRFMSDVFASHLAAKRIRSLLKYEKDDQEIRRIIEVLGEAKYDVFVMLCSLYYSVEKPNTILLDNLLHNIEKSIMYFINNATERSTDLSQTQNMFKNIIEKKYGENVISNRSVSEDIISQIENLLLKNHLEDTNEKRRFSH